MGAFMARLKSCPLTNKASPLRGFVSISLLYPTLKRGANNRRAYGALGTIEVVPCYKIVRQTGSRAGRRVPAWGYVLLQG
jgi:hypothetical protein